MRRFKEAAAEIVDGVLDAIENVDPGQLDALIEDLVRVREEGRTLLIVGAGRSSLVGRAFAMRLMHLDFNVYIMGETITPSMEEGDVALIISGSGSTRLPVTVADMARSLGIRVLR